MATLARPEPSFEEADRIQKFWEDNYQTLLKDYSEHYVAVQIDSGEVVAANRDLALLFYDLRDKGVDPKRDVAIQFISPRSASLLL